MILTCRKIDITSTQEPFSLHFRELSLPTGPLHVLCSAWHIPILLQPPHPPFPLAVSYSPTAGLVSGNWFLSSLHPLPLSSPIQDSLCLPFLGPGEVGARTRLSYEEIRLQNSLSLFTSLLPFIFLKFMQEEAKSIPFLSTPRWML